MLKEMFYCAAQKQRAVVIVIETPQQSDVIVAGITPDI
jgi:hypothetical protein